MPPQVVLVAVASWTGVMTLVWLLVYVQSVGRERGGRFDG